LQDHDFHGMPQSWRHAHDEIIRLANELAQSRDAARRSPAASEPDRTQEIEKLQDEIELLKVQVRAKEARIQGAKDTLQEYRIRRANYQKVNQATPGAIQRDTLLELQLQVTTHEAQLKIHEADIQEPLVRLKQAERRLARLQQAKPRLEPLVKSDWNITWAEAMFVNSRKADLGTVKRGLINHDFRITNHGQYPVRIASVRTSTGSLSAVPSKDELSPGESTELHIRLDTSNFSGSKTFKIYVTFDKPDRQ
jgi:hypothetical protein